MNSDVLSEETPAEEADESRTACAIFSERLVLARKKAGMTQEELANAIGVTKSAVEKWEYGVRDIGLDYMISISKALKAPTDYLLGLSDYDGNVQNMSMNDKAKAILAKAREKGEEHAFLFETTFKRYVEQTSLLDKLHKAITETGAVITKVNVKGGENLITNPAIIDYNRTATSLNDTEKLLMKFIQEPLTDNSEPDEFDLF